MSITINNLYNQGKWNTDYLDLSDYYIPGGAMMAACWEYPASKAPRMTRKIAIVKAVGIDLSVTSVFISLLFLPVTIIAKNRGFIVFEGALGASTLVGIGCFAYRHRLLNKKLTEEEAKASLQTEYERTDATRYVRAWAAWKHQNIHKPDDVQSIKRILQELRHPRGNPFPLRAESSEDAWFSRT